MVAGKELKIRVLMFSIGALALTWPFFHPQGQLGCDISPSNCEEELAAIIIHVSIYLGTFLAVFALVGRFIRSMKANSNAIALAVVLGLGLSTLYVTGLFRSGFFGL
jgi:hypothetical protein